MRTRTKYRSLSSLLTLHKPQPLLFWFQLFRSADKIDEDDALLHLGLSLLSPLPCGCKDLLILCNPITGPPYPYPESRQTSGMSSKIVTGCSFHITMSPWNLNLKNIYIYITCEKTAKEFLKAFLNHVLFLLLSNVSLQRYDQAYFGQILKKTLFHTVSSRTLWPVWPE